MNQKHSSQSVLLIIDMIEGFVNEGPLFDPYIRTIVPTLRRTMDFFKQQHWPMIAINDHHHSNSCEFKAFPPHCLSDTIESKLIKELHDEQLLVLHKNSVNAFMSPQFQAWFHDAPIYKRYVIGGCVTDICILHFALSLNSYFHEHDIDSTVVVLNDGVATYDLENHNRTEYHNAAINLMKQVGIHLIESESL
ncbi:MAG: cysteine hydrolase [Erysipelothrix sp.]|nr:cysteine hydrolase [Erysipelothrix sp.]